MEEKKSIAEQTFEYIESHPYIKLALRNDLLNYSSLARCIQRDCDVKNFDAIIVAIRRFFKKAKKEVAQEGKIREILAASQLEIRTGINVYIFKGIVQDSKGYSHIIKGSKFSMLVTDQKLHEECYLKTENAVEVRIRSPEGIEDESGVILEIYQKVYEFGINIIETYSCFTDTVIVIEKMDLIKLLEGLESLGIN